jgi:hypothetical protein
VSSFFRLPGVQHDLDTHPDSQDHGPEIARSPSGAAAFLEAREEDLQTALMQPKDVILARFTDAFLRERDGHQLTL